MGVGRKNGLRGGDVHYACVGAEEDEGAGEEVERSHGRRFALSIVFLRGIVGEYESWKHATGRELEDKAGKMEKAIGQSDRGRRNECMVFAINES